MIKQPLRKNTLQVSWLTSAWQWVIFANILFLLYQEFMVDWTLVSWFIWIPHFTTQCPKEHSKGQVNDRHFIRLLKLPNKLQSQLAFCECNQITFIRDTQYMGDTTVEYAHRNSKPPNYRPLNYFYVQHCLVGTNGDYAVLKVEGTKCWEDWKRYVLC